MIEWIIALLVHITLFASVFDIHFRSPIIRDIPRQCEGQLEPAAKRLVVFITDGLRADLLYNVTAHNKSDGAYFLRNVMENEGSWGVSHTRMPTKSRPGVVAILGGIYEDPSGVLNFFDENPVEFDHIFNYVKTTFYLGYPGMPTFFSKSKSTEKWIQYKFYDLWERVSKVTNASTLDQWVFDHVGEMFKSAEHNDTIRHLLMQDKIVFCLHLAGMDLVSHRRKSITKDVINNVEVIDEGAARVTEMFNEFYKDKETAYILTSDHGMTDWGTHGGGTPDETETPFIAWGAGITHDNNNQMTGASNLSRSSWRAQNLIRKDLNQADAAPLISVLLGIPIPINSVGVLPMSYLNVTEKMAAIARSCNSLQLLAQSERAGEVIRSGPISSFHKADPLPKKFGQEYKDRLESLMNQKNFTEVLKVSGELIDMSLKALFFYQNYYKNILLSVLGVTFIGWSVALITKLLSHQINHSTSTREILQETGTDSINGNSLSSPLTKTLYGTIKLQMSSLLDSYKLYYFICDFICLLLLLFSSIVIQIQNWPTQFHAYFMVPIILWWWIFRQDNVWINCFTAFKIRQHIGIMTFASICMCGSIFIIYSINEREALLWAMVGIALAPVVTLQVLLVHKIITVTWIISSIAMIFLPQYPIIYMKPNIRLVTLAGYIWIFTNVLYIQYRKLKNQARVFSYFTAFMTGLAVWNVLAVDNSLEKKKDPTVLNYRLAWSLLITSSFLPLVGSKNPFDRLIHICFSLSIPFILLSVRHEAVTLYFLCAFLVSWVLLEVNISSNKNITGATLTHSGKNTFNAEQLSINDLRRGFLFYFYIILGFFAIGNIDYLATFDITWVRCFVNELRYFVMACLILYKNAVVIMITLCAITTIYYETRNKADGIFIWFLCLNNITGYYFFLMVQNDGTWVDISYSLSHHIYAQSIAIVGLVLYPVAKYFTSTMANTTFKTMKSRATKVYLKHFSSTDV